MAETGPIAEIAEKLSDDLFGEFLWVRSGPINQDWACVQPESHEAKTHPTDVVFTYDEPYTKRRSYLQCDLKSYATGSITATSIKKALRSLAAQVSCAQISEQWQKQYTSGSSDYDVHGLLFVYNHDGEYDADFSKLLAQVKLDELAIPARSRIYVLGPADIHWLDNVRFEIMRMRGASGSEKLPERERCSFFYPQLSRKANIHNTEARAATLEMLTSPWITLKHRGASDDSDKYLVFARRPAVEPQEYEYLIDYLRHYQCLSAADAVTIKVLSTGAESSVIWGQAVDRYITNVVAGNNDSSLARIVRSIKFRPMQQVVSRFSSVEVGMRL